MGTDCNYIMVKKAREFFRQNFNFLTVAGLIVGAAGGFLYYYYIGCVSGTCPITSNPYISIIWGAVMGYLLAEIFNPKTKIKKDQTEDSSC